MRVIFLLAMMLGTVSPLWAQESGAQQFEKFNLQGYTDNGEKAWDVKGDTADIVGSTVSLTNVDANKYGDNAANLKAQKGSIDKDTGFVHLEKDVVITSQEGSQLKTDYLDWDKEKDLIKTEAPVVITDERLTATGKGLEAQPGLKSAQMKEDVTLTVKPDSAKTGIQEITVTCDGPMEIDQKNSRATFRINVVAVETDRTLKADKIEVTFDPQTNRIKEAVCTGNVQIIQGGNVTHSEKAVYNGPDQKLTLTGRPKLVMVPQSRNILPDPQKETPAEVNPE